MDENFNNKVRKEIHDTIDSISESLNITIDESFTSYHFTLNTLFQSKNLHINLYSLYIKTILFLDTYKLMSYKVKKGLSSLADKELFIFLSNIEDIDNFDEELQNDPSTFLKILEAVYEYYNLGSLTKILIMKTLSNEEHRKLLTITRNHEYDLLECEKEITLDYLINYYISEQKFIKDHIETYDKPTSIYMIISFIKDLYMINKPNATKLLESIIETDKTAIEILKNKGIKDEYILSRYTLYQKINQKDMIEKLVNDLELLYNVFNTIINFKVENNYDDDNFTLKK